jgi:hypothetical protein
VVASEDEWCRTYLKHAHGPHQENEIRTAAGANVVASTSTDGVLILAGFSFNVPANGSTSSPQTNTATTMTTSTAATTQQTSEALQLTSTQEPPSTTTTLANLTQNDMFPVQSVSGSPFMAIAWNSTINRRRLIT